VKHPERFYVSGISISVLSEVHVPLEFCPDIQVIQNVSLHHCPEIGAVMASVLRLEWQ
jgi:hypothetical protein